MMAKAIAAAAMIAMVSNHVQAVSNGMIVVLGTTDTTKCQLHHDPTRNVQKNSFLSNQIISLPPPGGMLWI